jgi:type I restriction enzyme, R subunit
LAEATLATPTDFAHTQAIRDLRAMLARLPRDSFPVRKVWQEIDSAWGDEFWTFLNAEKLDFLRLKVGPLLRCVAQVDVAAETFTHKVERLKLQTLQRKVSAELLQSIADDVSRLPAFVHEDPQKQPSLRVVLSNALPNATPQQLTQVITDLADEMRNRRDRPSAFVTLDLPDFVAERGHILIGPTGVPIYVEEYRRSVEARIQGIAENHPALVALRQGQEPTDEQLVNLERTLHVELAGGDLQLSPDLIRKAYGLRMDKRSGFLAFLRHVLELEAIPDYAAVVERAFTGHITGHHYTGDQIRFLRAVQEVFLTKGRLDEADLYEAPLTQFGRNAADRYFTPAQLRELVQFTSTLAA